MNAMNRVEFSQMFITVWSEKAAQVVVRLHTYLPLGKEQCREPASGIFLFSVHVVHLWQ